MDLDELDNLRFLQKTLNKSGIEYKLKQLEIKQGDEVNVEGVVFKYFD